MWYTKTNTKCCRKWMKVKWNEKVLRWTNNQASTIRLGRANNQAPIVKPTQKQNLTLTSQGASTRNETNLCLYN
jgi:hypothetical protein